jgi:hypothetical protein
MRANQRAAAVRMLLTTLVISLLAIGSIQAQVDFPVYRGKFTLQYRVHWGKSVLEPGDYRITVQSTGTPIIALITKADGNGGTRVISGVRSEQANGVNALLIKDKDGQLTVHSLSLADLGMVLIYGSGGAGQPDSAGDVGQEVTCHQKILDRKAGFVNE